MGDDNPKVRLSQGCTRRGGVLNRLSSGSRIVAVAAKEVTCSWLLMRHFHRYPTATFGMNKSSAEFPIREIPL